MKGLLLRLSSLDADAESAVRVIGFFDALMTDRAELATLLRSTAALAECPVGVDAPGRGLVLRADPTGTIDLGEPPPGADLREYADARFWLARPETALPLDEIVLERFALAGSLLLDRTVSSLPAVGDPALVQLVVSATAGIAERSRALHLLGITPTSTLRVAVSAAMGSSDSPPGPSPPTSRVISGPVGEHLVSLWTDSHAEAAPGVRTGVGCLVPAIRAADSWRDACTAFRLSSPEAPVVRSDDLGGLLVVVERLRPEDIAASPDVAALDRIAAEPGGDDLLAILRAYAVTDSVRKAAALVFRHHSTVAYRLEHAEAILGFPFSSAVGRFRLQIALTMRALGSTTWQDS
ncbi:helix-turn-helix domain-containing protein [Kribbella albertanoniae]|uniref:PucR family transcriptional regulator n=1 Tax=Kribbella albertanoniae TaxID=1266829 RepID=A0A4R4P6C9_9ACTN|nr:helix-turn-helix domain-containing protein [Kribbella albertanoniae]TDC17284.1 PucR family transcriptional regulator [Kribbella albertanoniae]